MIDTSTQPAFWLEIKKDYVVDNFERLLNYLRYYNYRPGRGGEQGDFNKSINCLGEVVADLITDMSDDCLYSHVGSRWGLTSSYSLTTASTTLPR